MHKNGILLLAAVCCAAALITITSKSSSAAERSSAAITVIAHVESPLGITSLPDEKSSELNELIGQLNVANNSISYLFRYPENSGVYVQVKIGDRSVAGKNSFLPLPGNNAGLLTLPQIEGNSDAGAGPIVIEIIPTEN